MTDTKVISKREYSIYLFVTMLGIVCGAFVTVLPLTTWGPDVPHMFKVLGTCLGLACFGFGIAFTSILVGIAVSSGVIAKVKA